MSAHCRSGRAYIRLFGRRAAVGLVPGFPEDNERIFENDKFYIEFGPASVGTGRSWRFIQEFDRREHRLHEFVKTTLNDLAVTIEGVVDALANQIDGVIWCNWPGCARIVVSLLLPVGIVVWCVWIQEECHPDGAWRMFQPWRMLSLMLAIDNTIDGANITETMIQNSGTEIVLNVNNEMAGCLPLWKIYDRFTTITCRCLVDSLNGIWFSIGWSLLLLIPAVVTAVKLSRHYRRMDSCEGYSTEYDEYYDE
ncbi:hypothetical protein LSH36_1007g00000 [Paralvinella palmiformis]|uniref:Uncharacterized protein n=1 Tax=Paralvinella palmiformis TaxID=53620 RepID=A0AAD9IWK7_9ANNE|nr:hypothetical protein LSH36_1007g00000 [Paralvinella palmiformis]